MKFNSPNQPSNELLSHQGRLLLRIGIGLLLYASFFGFAIPFMGSQRIGLSVHTLSSLQGVMVLALGLLWPKLKLGNATSRIAFWFLIYGTFAILAAYTIAAIWGVGIETIRLMGELPHGLYHGSAFQETFIKILSYSSGPPGIISFALVLWGLRGGDNKSKNT